MGRISNIVDNTPEISEIRKEYLKKAILMRYEQILVPSFKKIMSAVKDAEKTLNTSELQHAVMEFENVTILLAKEINTQATVVSVFNNTSEMLARAELSKMKDKNNYLSIHRLAVNGSADIIKSFFEAHPQITTVNICMENTEEGRKFAAEIRSLIPAASIKCGTKITVNELLPPNHAKSYQEALRSKTEQRGKARDTTL